MAPRNLCTLFNFLYASYFYGIHREYIFVAIITISFLVINLDNNIIPSSDNTANNKGIAYAHIFSDTENAVTKNVDGKYQVSFLPYPAAPLVNDTSTKLNFSVMENNTDVPFLFTSLVIRDKNTGDTVEQTPYKFHEFGDVTYPYTFRNDGDYTVAIQAKINGNPKYESRPLMAGFDVSVKDVQKMMNSFQQLMLFYVTPILAGIVGTVIYAKDIKGRKGKKKEFKK
jgi:hypothetical protein